jgi:hypothetical protein
MMSSEFVLPEWARDEEGNNLFQEAVAAGAIPNSLLFKSSATKFLQKKSDNQGNRHAGVHIFPFIS